MDQATGTIRLKGEFANADRRLWPGQFVDVVLTLARQPNAIVVPSQAIQNGQTGQFVMVIKPDMTVEARPVILDRSTDGQAVISKGLTAGEQVVTDGQLRLVPGVTKVELKQATAPSSDAPQADLLVPRASNAMNVAEIFIRRPVMTALVMLGILMFGIMGYRLLPVSDLPNVDFPTILVSASLPGATPDTMASAVAMPLEKQFSTIAGVDSMTSSSTQGSTQITLQFNLSRNLDAAAQDVQSMIAKAARDLPQNLPSPPSYQKVNPADQPILYLSLSSPTLRLSDVDEYAETLMAQRISMVSGVAQVSVYGAQKYAVHAKLDPKALASRQIGIDEVPSAIQNGNVNLPTGILYGTHQALRSR